MEMGIDGWLFFMEGTAGTTQKIALLYIDVVCETQIWEFYGC